MAETTSGHLSTPAAGGTALVDLLDRVVDRGVVVNGDVILQLAGIDLVRLDLRLLLVGMETSTELAAAATAERQDQRQEQGREGP